MYPGQLKHYGLLGIKLPLGHRFRWHSMWSIVSKQKMCAAAFSSQERGVGTEYKRVKDLSHRETVFQIGVKKKRKLSTEKNSVVVTFYWIHFSPTLTCPDTLYKLWFKCHFHLNNFVLLVYSIYRVSLNIVAACLKKKSLSSSSVSWGS